jgi:hypothetical protein
MKRLGFRLAYACCIAAMLAPLVALAGLPLFADDWGLDVSDVATTGWTLFSCGVAGMFITGFIDRRTRKSADDE